MKYYRCYISSHLAAGCVSCLCFSRSQEKRGERDQKLKAGWQGGLCRDRRGSRAEIPISHPSRCHTAHPAGWQPAGTARQRMGPSMFPGKAEQVGLELLKARLSPGRARTEPPDHPPQLDTPPGGAKPLVPGCPVHQPRRRHRSGSPEPQSHSQYRGKRLHPR